MKLSPTALLCPLGLLVIGLSSTAWADTTAEEMVVTPSRTEEALQSSPSQTTIITAADIAQDPAADIGQLLSEYANVDVARAGGPGQQTSVFMRGANSNQTLIMVDGVPINNGLAGQGSIQFWLNTQDIDHIEVVRGAHASLYGSGALGGVINIITRQAHGTNTEISGTWGTEHTYSSNLRQDFKDGHLSASISAGNNNTAGYPLFYPNNNQNYPPSNNAAHASGNYDRHGSAELGWTEDTWNLQMHYLENRGHNQFMDLNDPSPSAPYPVPPLNNTLDFINSVGSLNLQTQLSSDWTSTLNAARSIDSSNNRPDLYSPYTAIFYTGQNRIDWQNTLNLPSRQKLVLGSTYTDQNNHFTGTNYNTYVTSTLTQPLHNWAGYAEDTWHYHALELKAAGRYESDNIWGYHKTDDFTLGYALDTHHHVYVTRSTSFRAPTSEDLYYPGYSNPSLKPETSVGYEVGSKNLWGPVQLDVDVFRTLVSNLIAYDSISMIPQNIQSAYLRGVDTSLNIEQGAWKAGAEATIGRYTNLQNLNDLLLRPRRSLSVHTSYLCHQLLTQLSWQTASSSQAYGPVNLPGYGIVNLSTTWKATSWLNITGSIDNLTNRVYYLNANSTTQYYLAQPRLYTLGVNARY